MRSRPIVLSDVRTREYLIGHELTGEECQKPLTLLKPGEKGDLILKKANVWNGLISNVPRRFLEALTFAAWGYKGTGAHDLAINVLYHFSDGDEKFAREYAHWFLLDVVCKLPEGTPMRINADFLIKWVADKRNQAIDESSELHAPMMYSRLSPDHLMWDNDGQSILTPAEIA